MGETDVSRQLVLVLSLKFLQSFGYYGLSIVLTSFLTDDFGPVIDRIGMRHSLVLGGILLGFSRVALALTRDLSIATVILCTTLPFGESFGIPVLSKAVGASCKDDSRKFGYGLFYTAMNVAVLFVGPTIDAVRTGGLAEQANTTPYRVVALMCAACGFLSSAIAWSLLKGIDNSDTAATDNSIIGSTSTSKGSKGRTDIAADALELLLNSKRDDNGSAAVGSRGASSVENSGGSSNTNETKAPTTLWTPTFRRFLIMVLLLSGVRTMFRHLDATLPKYITRAFGADAPFGKVYAINPAIIIILVPLLSSLGGGDRQKSSLPTNAAGSQNRRGFLVRCCKAVPGVATLTNMHALDSIMLGSTVSTCSVLFLALGGNAHTSLAPAAMFVATLSLGEALWSPQFYAYTYEIAPEGQEGRYFALGNVPLFLPKLLAGILSGWALENHCTADDCSEGSQVWSLIFWSVVPFTATMAVLRAVGYLHK
eukprot:gene5692-8892_t